MIKLGSDNIGKMYLGGTEISKAYLGESLVYDVGGVTPVSPYDAQVEYLACTGVGEKIDTGIYPTEKTRVTGKVLFTEAKATFVASKWINGSYTEMFLFYAAANNLCAMTDHGGTQYRVLDIILNNSNRFNKALDIDFDVSRIKVSLNGTLLYDEPFDRGGGTFTSTDKMALFNYNDTNIKVTRIYWTKIYENGTLVKDFIPVRVGTTGYMYDKISGELFGNASSSGAFTYGNDVTT